MSNELTLKTLNIDGKEYKIIQLPGRPPAILDRDIAEIYETTTMRVNEARTRNPEKFPNDFWYQATREESINIADCDISKNLVFTHLPNLYAWEGCNMLATILKSEVAVQRSIQIVICQNSK